MYEMAANYSEKVSKSTPSAATETVSLLIRLDVDINLREGELRKQASAAGGGGLGSKCGVRPAQLELR